MQRDGRIEPVQVQPARSPGAQQATLGVQVQTRDPRIDLPFPVRVDAGQIGGPSAGLMIALTVYELADPADLTRGRVIAGTGTIDLRGGVGPVGGVPQKVEAAVDAGARLFLAPPVEVAEARAAAGDRLRVVEVATLAQAVGAVQAPDGPPAAP